MTAQPDLFEPRNRNAPMVSVDRALDQGERPTLWEPGQIHSSPAKRKLDRQKVLLWYAGYLLGTSDEAAEGLGMDRLCTRPRTTELCEEGLLMKRPDLPRKSTGKGGTAGVLEITLRGEREARAMLAGGAA